MRSRIVLTLLAALIAAPCAAEAQGYIELGGFGSRARFDRTLPWQFANAGGGRLSLGSGTGLNTFVFEGEASYFSLGEATVKYIPSRVRYLYAPTFGRVSLLMGGGAVRNDYLVEAPVKTRESEYGYTALAGFRFGMGDYMALRVEGVLDYITHPINGTETMKRNTNRSVQAGLSIPLWADRSARDRRPAAPAPVVTVQAAPTPAAPVATPADEPDADRDGVADVRDQCSNTAAGSLVDRDGCVVYRDTDNDGVIDPRDLCPATPVTEQVNGRGCAVSRDGDQDGVPDSRDRCLETPMGEPVNSVGCPLPAAPAAPVPEVDTDKDHVPDSRDACPNSPPGVPVEAATGCPPVLFKGAARTVTLRGVTFAPWKDDLTESSLAVLDDVARQLIEAPEIKVEIGGHTDSGGAYTRNLNLSLARAETVRAYLIMRGVDAGRLVARGYGPTKPTASNKTAGGRALNRRVELKRID